MADPNGVLNAELEVIYQRQRQKVPISQVGSVEYAPDYKSRQELYHKVIEPQLTVTERVLIDGYLRALQLRLAAENLLGKLLEALPQMGSSSRVAHLDSDEWEAVFKAARELREALDG